MGCEGCVHLRALCIHRAGDAASGEPGFTQTKCTRRRFSGWFLENTILQEFCSGLPRLWCSSGLFAAEMVAENRQFSVKEN